LPGWFTIGAAVLLLGTGAFAIFQEQSSLYSSACLPHDLRNSLIALQVAADVVEVQKIVYPSSLCGKFNDGSTVRNTKVLRQFILVDCVYALFCAFFPALLIRNLAHWPEKNWPKVRKWVVYAAIAQLVGDWAENFSLWWKADVSIEWLIFGSFSSAIKYSFSSLLLFVLGVLLFRYQMIVVVDGRPEIGLWRRPIGLSPQISGYLGMGLMIASIATVFAVLGTLVRGVETSPGVLDQNNLYKLVKRFIGPGNLEFAAFGYSILIGATLWSGVKRIWSLLYPATSEDWEEILGTNDIFKIEAKAKEASNQQSAGEVGC